MYAVTGNTMMKAKTAEFCSVKKNSSMGERRTLSALYAFENFYDGRIHSNCYRQHEVHHRHSFTSRSPTNNFFLLSTRPAAGFGNEL